MTQGFQGTIVFIKSKSYSCALLIYCKHNIFGISVFSLLSYLLTSSPPTMQTFLKTTRWMQLSSRFLTNM